MSIIKNVQNKNDWQNVTARENLGRKVNVHNFDVEKQTIVLMGDEHIGSKYYVEKEHRENVDWCLKYGVPIILMGDEMECMDINTKILTDDGWKYASEINNEKIITYNKEKDILEPQKHTSLKIFEYDGKIYHFKNKKLDMFVNPRHRILCRHYKGELKVRRAKDFSKIAAAARCWNVPKASKTDNKDYKIFDDEIRLIGWIITEGWMEKRGDSFRYYTSQSINKNKLNTERIEEIFKNLNIKPHIRKRKDGVITWRFTDKKGIYKKLIGNKTKRITREILNEFSYKQLKILFDTLLLGDGGKRGEFFTIDSELKDNFLELCSKINKITSVSRVKTTQAPNSKKPFISKPMWIVYTGNGKGNKGTKPFGHSTITNLKIIDYNGLLFGITVPNTFLVVKRNDRVFITGNTATKTSVGAGVFEQDDIVQEQLEKAIKIYKPLADEGLILGNHIGNHEARVYNSSGVNLSKIFSQMLNIPYLGVGAAHILRVGKQSYVLYTTHGSSGARLPHTKIANTIKINQMIEADIYAQGHVHQLSHHVQNFYRVNKRNKTIEEAQKHYVITGSYLQHWGSYAHVKNMEPARIGSPKLKLGGLERRIRVSLG